MALFGEKEGFILRHYFTKYLVNYLYKTELKAHEQDRTVDLILTKNETCPFLNFPF